MNLRDQVEIRFISRGGKNCVQITHLITNIRITEGEYDNREHNINTAIKKLKRELKRLEE